MFRPKGRSGPGPLVARRCGRGRRDRGRVCWCCSAPAGTTARPTSRRRDHPEAEHEAHVRAVDDRRQHPRAAVEGDRAGQHAYAGPVVHAHHRAHDRAELAADPAAGDRAAATQPTTIPPAERPAAEIYNNTPRKGLADSVAGRARQAGWTVAGADNWHGKIAESTVYYPPGMLDAANQLARDIGVGRTKGALDNMKKDRLTVILTSDYAG